jgi:hypothetical protein
MLLCSDELFEATTEKDRDLLVSVMKILWAYKNHRASVGRTEASPVNCHVICEVLGKHIKDVKVIYGYYRGFKDYTEKDKRKTKMEYLNHSWLETPEGAIIEPYPPGFLTLQPLLYPKGCNYSAYGYNSYVPHSLVKQSVMDKELRRRIRNFSRRLKTALAKEQD